MPLIVKTTPAATRERTRVLLSNYRGQWSELSLLDGLLQMVRAAPETDRAALSRIFDAEMIAARMAEIDERQYRQSMAPWRGDGPAPPCGSSVALLMHLDSDEGPLTMDGGR